MGVGESDEVCAELNNTQMTNSKYEETLIWICNIAINT
jgi:hypothetical protein